MHLKIKNVETKIHDDVAFDTCTWETITTKMAGRTRKTSNVNKLRIGT